MADGTVDVTRYLTCSACGESVPYTATIRLEHKGEGPVITVDTDELDIAALKEHLGIHEAYDREYDAEHEVTHG